MGDEKRTPAPDPATETERLRRENELLKEKLEAALERERKLREENRDLKKQLAKALHKAHP